MLLRGGDIDISFSQAFVLRAGRDYIDQMLAAHVGGWETTAKNDNIDKYPKISSPLSVFVFNDQCFL